MTIAGPEDLEVDPHRERAFRRGYVNGIYDAILGLKSKLSEDEFNVLDGWLRQQLVPWITSNLNKAVKPPIPSDPSLQNADGRHGDGPFKLG